MKAKQQKKSWIERMREQYAHIPILPLDELKALPEAEEYDAGIYFLWLNDELRYIGKSSNIAGRLALQDYANKFHKLRNCKSPKPIPYDRHTCIVFEHGMIRGEEIAEKLRDHERAYIAHYTPPMNSTEQNPGT
jgi:hypothetical protein